MRRRGDNDSMELLLDTICNVFGGILFLALLVCILAVDTSHHVELDQSPDEIMADRVVLRKAELRLAHVQQLLGGARAKREDRRRLLERLIEGADPGESRAFLLLLEEMAEHARSRESLSESLDAAEDAYREARMQTAAAREARLQAEADRSAAEEAAATQLTDAQAQAEAARQRQAVQLRLPRARVTFKQEVGFFLCHGRLRMPIRYGAGGGLPIGRDHAEVTRLNPNDPIAPSDFVVNAGLKLDGTDMARTGINRRLTPFRPADHYVTIVVWPDSYQEFRLLRDHIVKQGYEYRLLLMDENEPVGFGDVVPRVQ